jgi:hypothetical protein
LLCWRLTAQSALAAAAAAMIVVTASGFGVVHFFDHTAHASGGALPADSPPLCKEPATETEIIEE